VTTATLIAQLRDHLAATARPGLAGVQARDAAHATLDQLADAVRLMEQRWADREAQRFGAMLRHMGTPEDIYAAERAARQSNPELWEGRLPSPSSTN
jgi:hypothetical protein